MMWFSEQQLERGLCIVTLDAFWRYFLSFISSIQSLGEGILNNIVQPEEAAKVRLLISHPTVREVSINPVSSFISPAFLSWLVVNCKENRSCVCYWPLKMKDHRCMLIPTRFTCTVAEMWSTHSNTYQNKVSAFEPGVSFIRSQLLFKVAVYSGAIIQLSSN